MISFSWKFPAALALVLMISGCGPGGPRLYKAGGIVTHNKAPLAGAHVTFAYEDGNFASGYTDKDGKFELAYNNRTGGTVPGKCKVTITKRAGDSDGPPPAILDKVPKSAEEQRAKQQAQRERMQAFEKKDAAGAKADFEKSVSLEVTTDESKNNFAIDL
jgi:hypothetical protein